MKSMKKTISAVLALLMCAAAAGCGNNGDVVITDTEISFANNQEALESAAAEQLSERLSETEEAKEEVTVTAITIADDPEETEHVDTAPAETDIEEASEIVTVPNETEPSETAVSQTEPEQTSYSAGELSESGTFNTAFLKEVAKQNNNFVISPLSVKLALNMASLGAGENSDTEKELLTIFGYESQADMISESEALISDLNREDGSITVNDSVWISDKKDISISKEYTRQLAEIFNAEQFTEDLSDQKIVQKFNDWVSKNTNELIPEMISKPFDESARMVLVNTLYFNNKWGLAFPEYASDEYTFYGINGEKDVMFMRNESFYEYAEGELFKGVILPYKDGSRMKLYIPLDEEVFMNDIIQDLSPAELNKELDLDFKTYDTIVRMPRFECEYKDSLKNTLKLLGISSAFDSSTADFSGMPDGDSYSLFISDVIQAAKIKCGEKGTEAAAATMVGLDTGAAMMDDDYDPKLFIADRPFLYMIESPSGEVLFMGLISSF